MVIPSGLFVARGDVRGVLQGRGVRAGGSVAIALGDLHALCEVLGICLAQGGRRFLRGVFHLISRAVADSY